mmetsp:Transcript_29033/g.82520  ORF Transcript_29033/g.82520 Transcript_29033/m.82520 type:complete len:238 (+) Transcript_29033:889-1602(+)
MSAGTRLPASSKMTSPGTRSSGGNCKGNKLRSATWRYVDTRSTPCIFCKEFIVASACCSVHHCRTPEDTMTKDKITGVTRSSPFMCKAKKSSTATQSHNKTLKTPPKTCRMSSHHMFGFLGGVIAFLPKTPNLARMAASSRPQAQRRSPAPDTPSPPPVSIAESAAKRTSRNELAKFSARRSNSMTCAAFRTWACFALTCRSSSSSGVAAATSAAPSAPAMADAKLAGVTADDWSPS